MYFGKDTRPVTRYTRFTRHAKEGCQDRSRGTQGSRDMPRRDVKIGHEVHKVHETCQGGMSRMVRECRTNVNDRTLTNRRLPLVRLLLPLVRLLLPLVRLLLLWSTHVASTCKILKDAHSYTACSM